MIFDVGVSPITRDGARADAEHELSKGMYHRYDDPWPVRVYDWFMHQLGRLASAVAERSPGGGAGAIALLVLLIALVVLVRWRLGPIQRRRSASAAVLAEQSRSAADYRAAAVTAAETGAWSDAVVARMRAIVRDLEERGIVDERPGRTADEFAVAVAEVLPVAEDKVRAATDVFDAVVYGGRAASADSYATVAAADELVRSTRPRVTAG